uniref:MSP domain-containing protein n=1 Tax=Rhabditophanes sp. KR3021 TaxID=114890 RepID=A0AC35TWM7_9BILA
MDSRTARGRFYVRVDKESIQFIHSHVREHTQKLTIFNPYSFGIHYTFLCSVKDKYDVSDPSSFLPPNCKNEISIRHMTAHQENEVGVRDILRIDIRKQDSQSVAATKSIPLTLVMDHAASQNEQHRQLNHPHSGLSSSSQQGQHRAQIESEPRLPQVNWFILLTVIISVIILLLPTEVPECINIEKVQSSTDAAVRSSVDDFLIYFKKIQIPTNVRLGATYAMGMCTVLIIRN